MSEVRRYVAVVQDARGYAQGLEPAPPEGPEPPMIHTVVRTVDFEAVEAERDRYRQALEEVAAIYHDDSLSNAEAQDKSYGVVLAALNQQEVPDAQG